MNDQGKNHPLMEHILCLLTKFYESETGISWLVESSEETSPIPGITSQDVREVRTFVNFLDEMPGGFLIYRADGDEEILFANWSLLRIFQCDTLKEFRAYTGNSFKGLVHPDDLEAVERSIWDQVSESQYDLDYVEYRIRRKDGCLRWIEDYGHFIRSDSAGGIFYVFLSDATEKRERLQMERRLHLKEKREREQRLQDLMEEYDRERSDLRQEQLRRLKIIEGLSVNYESILYVDLDKDQIRPYRLSERTSRLFSERFHVRSYSQYCAEYLGLWVHPDDQEAMAAFMDPQRLCRRLASSKSCYTIFRTLEGQEEKSLQLQVVNVGSGVQPSQLVLGYRRVDTELQKEMDQKQLLADALNEANLAITAKNTFLSNISHEMRTPLNAIFGFTTLAKMSLQDPKAALENLEQVEAASRRLLDQITKVLEVSALSAAVAPAEVECSLCDILQEVYDFLQPQAQEKNIDFRLDCGRVLHNDIFADQDRLRQLVTYLANNAVTYTGPGGRVTITLTEAETLPNNYAIYHLAVEDNGIGISKDFLDRVFEPFSREKNSTLSGIHGIGLGLTIAKSIVDMMDGAITVQSEEGRGSTFTVTLHLRFQPPVASESRQNAPVPIDGQKILLVEDNEINRELETELLEAMGFLITIAENGQEAVDIVSRAGPEDIDLILMDLQMPVMDGWQATAAIRALPDPALAKLPIIALSANMLPSDRRRSKEAGIDVHLTKPLDLSQLLDAVEQITGKHLI